METSQIQAGFYILGMILNVGALAYALSNEQYLFALTFLFVLVYLVFRYRTREQYSYTGGSDE